VTAPLTTEQFQQLKIGLLVRYEQSSLSTFIHSHSVTLNALSVLQKLEGLTMSRHFLVALIEGTPFLRRSHPSRPLDRSS
jgi:hypothetical protein